MVLTQAQREYMDDKSKWEGRDEINGRSRIRENIVTGIGDFAHIFEELEERDQQMLTDFYPDLTDGETIGDSPLQYQNFQGNLTRMIAFALQLADDMGMSASQVLEYALQHYIQHRPEVDSSNVHVDIEIDPVEYADDEDIPYVDDSEDLPDYPLPVTGFFRDSLSDGSETQFDVTDFGVSEGQVEEQYRD